MPGPAAAPPRLPAALPPRSGIVADNPYDEPNVASARAKADVAEAASRAAKEGVVYGDGSLASSDGVYDRMAEDDVSGLEHVERWRGTGQPSPYWDNFWPTSFSREASIEDARRYVEWILALYNISHSVLSLSFHLSAC